MLLSLLHIDTLVDELVDPTFVCGYEQQRFVLQKCYVATPPCVDDSPLLLVVCDCPMVHLNVVVIVAH